MDQRRIRLELTPARAAAVLLLLSLGCVTTGAAGGATGGPVGAPLPPLTVDGLSGKSINVASYKGRVLLLDVWASWCDPCKQELPVLNDMARRLKSQGIDIYGGPDAMEEIVDTRVVEGDPPAPVEARYETAVDCLVALHRERRERVDVLQHFHQQAHPDGGRKHTI